MEYKHSQSIELKADLSEYIAKCLSDGYSLAAIEKALVTYGCSTKAAKSLIAKAKKTKEGSVEEYRDEEKAQISSGINHYIKDCISKGYGAGLIKDALKKFGLQRPVAARLVDKYYRTQTLRLSAAAFLFILLAGTLFFLPYIGYTTLTAEYNYTLDADITFTESSVYLLPVSGALTSLKLTGTALNDARVYLKNENNSYLVFDGSVTNNKPLLSEPEYEQIPGTGNRSMAASLSGRNLEQEMLEFSLSSSFDWHVDYSKLCTIWRVNNYSICQGSDDCCSFIELGSGGAWNDSFYLAPGRYQAEGKSLINAQLVYYEVNLSIPYSEIIYSGRASQYVDFDAFEDACIETCILPSINLSSPILKIELENSTLTLQKIKYSLEKERTSPPLLVRNIEDLTIIRGENAWLNLSSYFADEDNDITLYYGNNVENVSITIEQDTASMIPANFTGVRYVYFSASDGYYTTTSNIFEIKVIDRPVAAAFANVTISEVKPNIRINEPVRWIKKVDASAYVENLSLNISSDALNVSVYVDEQRVPDEKVAVIVDGIKKDASLFIAEKRIEQIEEKAEKLTAKKEQIMTDRPTAAGEIADINKQLTELSSEKNRLTGYVVASTGKGILASLFNSLFDMDMTGYAVKDKKEKNKSKDIEIIIEEPVTNVTIEYYTEAPISTETVLSTTVKQVVISSNTHYENITAYANISPETNNIRLYWIVNQSRQAVDYTYLDNNNNSLADMIEWTVPLLSSQTYEIIIEISKAEHLDSSKAFVADAYGYVYAQDDNWTLIPSGDYLRVTFEENLTSDRDITLFARGNGSVNVYAKDSDLLVAAFEGVIAEDIYIVNLAALIGGSGAFDFLSIGDIEYDIIFYPLSSHKPSEEKVTYTSSTETRCSGNACNLVLYSGTRFIQEDNQWKKVEEARSLKDSNIKCIIDFDGEHYAECLDFNYTHRLISSSIGNPYLTNKDIPIQIMKKNTSNILAKANAKNEKDLNKLGYFTQEKIFINFEKVNEKKEQWIKADIGDIIKIGENSTMIVLQDANTENLEDTYIDEGSAASNYGTDTALYLVNSTNGNRHALLKFDISQIPSGMQINSAQLNVQSNFNALDASTEGYNVSVHHFYNKSWVETDYTWNNRPTQGIHYNSTYTDTLYFFGGEGEPLGWHTWNVVNSLASEYILGDTNLSFYLKAHDVFGTPSTTDSIQIYSKEYAVAGDRPFLNITYSDVTPPGMSFSFPTPSDGSTQTAAYVPINISITESSLAEIKYNWNGTNFTLYNDSLVLFMNMNNFSALGESNTKVVDHSIYSKNGTPTNAIFTANGKYGGAYQFDGNGDRVTVPDNDMYTFSSGGQDKPFSVAAWVYHTGFDAENALISKYQNSGSAICEWNTQTIGNNYYFQLLDGSALVRIKITSSFELSTNTWYHVVFTYDGSGDDPGLNIYVNATLDPSPTRQEDNDYVSLDNTAAEIDIGMANRDVSGLSMRGLIDEVMIFNKSLTQAEVTQLYMSNLYKYNSTQWYLYINQSKNITSGLSNGTYTYSAYAKDASGNYNSTQRTITIGSSTDAVSPSLAYLSPTPDAGITQAETNVQVNVSIFEQNLNEVKWNWNGTNFTLYNDSLVLMMNFENLSALGESNSKVSDLSKYQTNGTPTSGATYNSSGRYGGAYRFNGVSGMINLSTAGSTRTLSAFSISTWVKTGDIGNVQKVIVNRKNTCGANDWQVTNYIVDINTTGNVNMYFVRSDGQWQNTIAGSNKNIADSSWHYITADYDGSTNRLYIDGILNGTRSSVGAPNVDSTTVTQIGTDNIDIVCNAQNVWFNGSMDELRIYNRSLSSQEVYQIYSSNLYKFNSTQWYLYVNQSKNSTTGLANDIYTYYAAAKDSAGNSGQTDERTITIGPDLTPPKIEFKSPTPADSITQEETNAEINISIIESSLGEIKYNWNGTNFTLYNDSLVLLMNFENLSAIGESNSQVVDNSRYGNNGTVGGTTIVSGVYGKARSLSGSTSDYIETNLFNNFPTTQL